jgi:hypothetical protein
MFIHTAFSIFQKTRKWENTSGRNTSFILKSLEVGRKKNNSRQMKVGHSL